MERRLADTYRRVGPDLVHHQIRRYLVGGHHPNPVGNAARLGVGSAQGACPFIYIHRPDLDLWAAPQCQGDRDRSVATSDVHQDAGPHRRAVTEQQPGAGIDPVGGEDAVVGAKEQMTTFGQDQFHRLLG